MTGLVDEEAIHAVIAAHARKRGFGRNRDEIMYCQCGKHHRTTGSDNKVIYDDWYHAEACAQALEPSAANPPGPTHAAGQSTATTT